MTNTETKAARWVGHLADHPDVPFGPQLRQHFEAGRITRLCDCGCNSFDLEIPAQVVLEPISTPGRSGMFFEIGFESYPGAQLAFLVFTDERGYLSGVDVTCGGANHSPVPDDIQVGKVVYRSRHAV
jgi:hypothetical protein